MKETAVTFYSEGIRLAADYRLPDGMAPGERRPGIVCCHGYSGNKNIHTAKAAVRLTEAGFPTLCFDHRGFGNSEGKRARMIPIEQVEDIRDALTWLGAQAEVDAGRLGLWGQSWGGANVAHVASIDERVKCTVSLSGIGDGERWLREIRPYWKWRELLRKLEADRVRRAQTGEGEWVDLYELMVPDPNTEKYYNEARTRYPDWRWTRPLETAEATISFKPERMVSKISPRAVMFIHTEGDFLVPMDHSIAMHDNALEPKRLKIFRGVSHQDAYFDPVHAEIMVEAVAWYRQHLAAA